ncbi:MAG: CsbD family protein [Bdellovibrionales bacterium]|nr:CsbD family protein [Bdellovibrionales bacterium]
MDKNVLKGDWKQLKGEIKKKWGKITDDDLQVAEGNRDKLVGKIQAAYGEAKDKIERDLSELESGCHCS